MWLPGSVAQSLLDERAARKEAERVFGDWAKRLRAIDSRFELLLITQDVDTDEAELRKGFYYVKRNNEDGTHYYWEIRNPDGGYREPDEQVLEAFRRMDGSRTDLTVAWKRQQERLRQQHEHRKEHQREEVRGQLGEQAAYKFRTSVGPYGPGSKVADLRRQRRQSGGVVGT